MKLTKIECDVYKISFEEIKEILRKPFEWSGYNIDNFYFNLHGNIANGNNFYLEVASGYRLDDNLSYELKDQIIDIIGKDSGPIRAYQVAEIFATLAGMDVIPRADFIVE